MSESIHATVGAPPTQEETQTQATGTSQAQPEPQANSGRGPDGRFTKGNFGGPGNPFARQTAALRQALLNKVTAQEIEAIADKLMQLAKEGTVAAAKLLFLHTIGKPAPAVEPDHL